MWWMNAMLNLIHNAWWKLIADIHKSSIKHFYYRKFNHDTKNLESTIDDGHKNLLWVLLFLLLCNVGLDTMGRYARTEYEYNILLIMECTLWLAIQT